MTAPGQGDWVEIKTETGILGTSKLVRNSIGEIAFWWRDMECTFLMSRV